MYALLKRFAVVLAALLLVGCDVPDPSAGDRVPVRPVPVSKTVYRYGPTAAHTLRVFRPSRWRSSDRRPVVVYVHGGAWVAGSSTDLDPLVLDLLAAGAVVASVEYSLGVPAAVQSGEVLAAATWVQANTGKLGADPTRTFLAGHSAGGHLVLLAGLSGVSGVAQPPKGIRGVFVSAGPTALDVPEFDPFIIGFRVHDVLATVNSCPSSPCPASLLSFISPLRHVDPADPPVYYVAGTLDPVVPVSQGRLLADAYAAAGMDHKFWFDVVENADHQAAVGANAVALRRFLEAPPV